MLGGDGPLRQLLATVQDADPGMSPTLWYREQQAIVQTIAQNVSQSWKTPATLARPCLEMLHSIRNAVLIYNRRHNDNTVRGSRAGD